MLHDLTMASPWSHLIEPLPSSEFHHASRQQARLSRGRYPLSPPKRPLLLCRRLNFHGVAEALSAAFLIKADADSSAAITVRSSRKFPHVSFLALLFLLPYVGQKFGGCSGLQSMVQSL